MINCLYIHIPFCIRKCIYCDFFSVPYDEDLALRYVDALVRELEMRKRVAGELKTVYIGGGTPTTAPTLSLAGVIRKIKDSFTLSPDAEITTEANPGTIDEEKARALSDAGANRFSFGVQSFNDHELKLLGRAHTFKDALRAVVSARHADIGNVSIDLMYGIPGQTPDGWRLNLEMAVELSPEHISVYELTPERGTPLYDAIMRREIEKPPEEAIVEMYYLAIDRLNDAGYRHYEISNFAKPGFECRHNINYWDRGEYIGVGAGAHGFAGDRRTKNTPNIEGYIDALGKGELAVEEEIEVSCEEALREFIFLGLRKTEGLDIGTFREDLAIDLLSASEDLIAEGLLASDGAHVRLTRKGLIVSNTVITRLFEKLML